MVAVRLYQLAVKCKGSVRTGWWSPRYVRQLRAEAAEMLRMFRALPEPRLPVMDRAMRLVLQALGIGLCGFRHDKERVAALLFALHNLPRSYLPPEHPMRCGEAEALEYARSWLEKANIHPE